MSSHRLPNDLERAVKFHGHYCGGILIGYRATKAALDRLGARRAEDEELIAIVENDSCAADAVQALAGCTFGKGNLFFRDHGKHVYTFALRPSGRAVRLSLKPGERMPAEQFLRARPEELFWIEEGTVELPAPAEIHESVICTRCGEPVMATRARRRSGKAVCIPCANGRRGAPRQEFVPAHPRRREAAPITAPRESRQAALGGK